MKRPSLERRFWSKVSFGHGPDACWMWKAATDQRGHGIFSLGKSRIVKAHRFVLGFFLVYVHGDDVVHHRCENPSCVNPWHLEILDSQTTHRRIHGATSRGNPERPRDPVTGRFSAAQA